MSSSWIAVIAVLIAAFGLAFAIGRLMTLRSGRIKGAKESPALGEDDIAALGLSGTGPTVLHFTAAWCGPCAAVRRVVDRGCAQAFGPFAAYDVHLRRRRPAAIPRVGGAHRR